MTTTTPENTVRVKRTYAPRKKKETVAEGLLAEVINDNNAEEITREWADEVNVLDGVSETPSTKDDTWISPKSFNVNVFNSLYTKNPVSIPFNKVLNEWTVGFESIDCKKPVRPYFDIDLDGIDISTADIILDKAKKVILASIGDETISEDDMAISQSHRDGKVSFHIVLADYYTSVSNLKSLCITNRKNFKEIGIDDSVYRSGMSKFRLINMAKDLSKPNIPKKTAVTFIDELDKHVIQYVPEHSKQLIIKNKGKSTVETVSVSDSIGPSTKKAKNTTDLPVACRDEDVVLVEKIETDIGNSSKKKGIPNNNDDYSLWLKKAVYIRVLCGDEDGKNEFIKYSKKSPKYNQTETEELWNNVVKYDYSRVSGFFKTYENVKLRFEINNFSINNPVCFVEINEREGVLERVILRNKQDFRTRYESLAYFLYDSDKGTFEKKEFLASYFKDVSKRCYESMNNLPPPLLCQGYILNRWEGFKYDTSDIMQVPPDDDEDVKFILDFISVIANHREDVIKFLILYIAHIIQYPGIKPLIAIVFHGKQGCGKTSLYEFIRALIGSMYCFETVDPENELFSRFATGRLDKLLVLIDEAKVSDFVSSRSQVFGAITGSTLNTEYKGGKTIKSENINRFFMMSNSSIPIKLDPEDRRFVVMTPSEELIGKHDYFEEFYTKINNPIFMRKIFCWFKNVYKEELKTYKFTSNRPKTKEYEDLKVATVTGSIKWIQYYITSLVYTKRMNYPEDKTTDWANHDFKISNLDLLNAYRNYFSNMKNFDVTKEDGRSLSHKVRKFFESIKIDMWTRGYLVNPVKVFQALKEGNCVENDITFEDLYALFQ